MGAAIALADAPGTGPAVKALAESPDAQVAPAVAVNPAVGAPNILAAIVGTDWRSGGLQPQSAVATGSIVAATGVTTWASQSTLPHTGPDFTHGSPDIAWGPGNKVYAVEVARDTDDTSNPCLSGAGIYLFVSSNGGVSWGPEIEIVTNGAHQSVTDPSIAYDSVTGRIYVAYTKTDPCSALPGDPGATSQVRLMTLFRDDAVGGTPVTGPSGASTQTQVRPSVTVLPNGGVGIAYYDASQNSGNVLFVPCGLAIGSHATPTCGTPVTVDDSATDTSSPALPEVHVRPSAAADASGRVVVTWSKMTDSRGMDVFSATSRTSGATFGSPQLVSGGSGSSNQIDPSIAIDPTTGRADIAFLDSQSTAPGYIVAVSASKPPSAGSTTETWSASVPVETTPIVPTAPFLPGPLNIGDRLGIAEIPRASGPPWTLIAWTDTRSATDGTPRNEDVYSTVLLHGTTTPVGVDTAASVQRNVPQPIGIRATDADADPLMYTVLTDGALGHAEIPDINRPVLNYTGSVFGTDHVKVQISDGTFQTTATITLQVLNTPPVITCTSLTTPLNTPLSLSRCAQDDNGDAVSLDASAPQHGKVQRINGDLSFVPDTGFDGTAQVTLTATDGIDAANPKTITIQVGTPGVTPVAIVGDASRSAFTDRPITLRANTTVDGADSSKISWSFDGKVSDQGQSVAHLFSKVGKYPVTARVGTGPAATVTVYVQKPPLSITRTDLGKNGVMGLRVKLARPGKLTVALLGVHGAAHKPMKLKLGTHMIRMRLPASVRARGTVIVKLKLTTSGGTTKIYRAVLLSSP